MLPFRQDCSSAKKNRVDSCRRIGTHAPLPSRRKDCVPWSHLRFLRPLHFTLASSCTLASMVTRHRASAPSFEGGRDTRVGKNVSIGGISPLRTHFVNFPTGGTESWSPYRKPFLYQACHLDGRRHPGTRDTSYQNDNALPRRSYPAC